MAASPPLSAVLATWHVRHRATMLRLVLAGAFGGLLVFVEDALVEALARSLGPTGAAFSAPGDWLRFTALSPLSIVVFFVGARLLYRLNFLVEGRLSADLLDRSRSELELEVLRHVSRKPDSFFASHSHAEVLNRVTLDVSRVAERRVAYADLVQWTCLIGGNILYLLLADWRLGALGAVACGLGAAWAYRSCHRVRALDRDAVHRDDAVKNRLADLLRAAPELQVAGVFGRALETVRAHQKDRSRAVRAMARHSTRIELVEGLSGTVSLASLVLVAAYYERAEAPAAAAALVPVILRALPTMFDRASEAVQRLVAIGMARTSEQRLLEYETHRTAAPARLPDPAAPDVELANATLRHRTPDGRHQGGISDASIRFTPGQWTTIVGPAGSGKSTLLQLVLGRSTPTSGTARVGGVAASELSLEDRARLYAYMPQSPVILDGSIRENLALAGECDAVGAMLSAREREILERSGLADVCRTHALDTLPLKNATSDAIGRRIRALRAHVQHALAESGFVVEPYEEHGPGADAWFLEHLCHGRSDRGRVASVISHPATQNALRGLSRTEQGMGLIAFGERLLHESRQYLSLPTHAAFQACSPHRQHRRVWTLRRSALEAPSDLAHFTVALLATPSEADGGDLLLRWVRTNQALASAIQERIGSLVLPLDPDRLHPFIPWRDNLTFAYVRSRGAGEAAAVGPSLLRAADGVGLSEELLQIGLDFEVGRGGTRLSGGQRQLVALCRAALRDAPIFVLDEPTSALDPASKARVSELIRWLTPGRVIVTVTHDDEVMKHADEIVSVDGGRIADVAPTGRGRVAAGAA